MGELVAMAALKDLVASRKFVDCFTRGVSFFDVTYALFL